VRRSSRRSPPAPRRCCRGKHTMLAQATRRRVTRRRAHRLAAHRPPSRPVTLGARTAGRCQGLAHARTDIDRPPNRHEASVKASDTERKRCRPPAEAADNAPPRPREAPLAHGLGGARVCERPVRARAPRTRSVRPRGAVQRRLPAVGRSNDRRTRKGSRPARRRSKGRAQRPSPRRARPNRRRDSS
jgi:hypothetical protein